MKKTLLKARPLQALLIAATLAAGPVLADPPDGKGEGKGKGKERVEQVEYRHSRRAMIAGVRSESRWLRAPACISPTGIAWSFVTIMAKIIGADFALPA